MVLGPKVSSSNPGGRDINKITVDQLKHYLEKTQKIMPFEIILAPNLDSEMLNITEKLNKKTKKLFEEHKEALSGLPDTYRITLSIKPHS